MNSVPLSEETVSMEVNVLSREYNFEDDVFADGRKDKGPKETRLEKRKRRYARAKEHKRVISTSTLLRRSYASFKRRIR